MQHVYFKTDAHHLPNRLSTIATVFNLPTLGVIQGRWLCQLRLINDNGACHSFSEIAV